MVFFENSLDSKALQDLVSKFKRVRLEICAGAGDWVLSKCEQQPEILWLALEIRYDRAHEIWRKLKLKGVSNLAILVGDAKTLSPVLLACVLRKLSA